MEQERKQRTDSVNRAMIDRHPSVGVKNFSKKGNTAKKNLKIKKAKVINKTVMEHEIGIDYGKPEYTYYENGFTDEMLLPNHLVLMLMNKYANERVKAAIPVILNYAAENARLESLHFKNTWEYKSIPKYENMDTGTQITVDKESITSLSENEELKKLLGL